jgi:hypothetical protein
MGLDMYLNAERYVSKYEDEILHKELNGIGFPMEVIGVRCRAMYWRKANQIHQWFVKNVQDGEDDCGEYPVSRENLQNLVEVCKKVLENKNICHELLPTSSGFFFGSTEYNEDYFYDVENTLNLLQTILAKTSSQFDGEWVFSYQSSW